MLLQSHSGVIRVFPAIPSDWKDVSFECQSGDIVGIVGKNGTGKSSLIRVLMGLEKPKSGKISIAGKYASKQQRRHKSFYVMQDVDYQFFAGSVISEMVTGFEKNFLKTPPPMNGPERF